MGKGHLWSPITAGLQPVPVLTGRKSLQHVLKCPSHKLTHLLNGCSHTHTTLKQRTAPAARSRGSATVLRIRPPAGGVQAQRRRGTWTPLTSPENRRGLKCSDLSLRPARTPLRRSAKEPIRTVFLFESQTDAGRWVWRPDLQPHQSDSSERV
ncbi:hypothetical protein AOLI_G00210830 [Acnodon oligacanthus]